MKNAVAAGEGVAILAVTTADHADHRDVAAQTMAHHAFIAGGDTFVGQLQITEGVVFVHIDAGVIQHQIRLIQRQQIVERVVDHFQIVGIAHAFGQRYVPVTFGFACRKILLAVQGHGNRLRGVMQDARGAVALMHVAIEDQHAIDPAALQQVLADDRQVIEDAVAPTSIKT